MSIQIIGLEDVPEDLSKRGLHYGQDSDEIVDRYVPTSQLDKVLETLNSDLGRVSVLEEVHCSTTPPLNRVNLTMVVRLHRFLCQGPPHASTCIL